MHFRHSRLVMSSFLDLHSSAQLTCVFSGLAHLRPREPFVHLYAPPGFLQVTKDGLDDFRCVHAAETGLRRIDTRVPLTEEIRSAIRDWMNSLPPQHPAHKIMRPVLERDDNVGLSAMLRSVLGDVLSEPIDTWVGDQKKRGTGTLGIRFGRDR